MTNSWVFVTDTLIKRNKRDWSLLQSVIRMLTLREESVRARTLHDCGRVSWTDWKAGVTVIPLSPGHEGRGFLWTSSTCIHFMNTYSVVSLSPLFTLTWSPPPPFPFFPGGGYPFLMCIITVMLGGLNPPPRDPSPWFVCSSTAFLWEIFGGRTPVPRPLYNNVPLKNATCTKETRERGI